VPANGINCCRWRVYSVSCQLYEQRDLKHSSVLTSESAEKVKKKKHASSSNGVVHDTNNSKDVYSPFTSAVQQLRYYTACYNRCLQTGYRSMSTASCSSDKSCSLRQFFHIFPLPFPYISSTFYRTSVFPPQEVRNVSNRDVWRKIAKTTPLDHRQNSQNLNPQRSFDRLDIKELRERLVV
jgi:hypothetical protein